MVQLKIHVFNVFVLWFLLLLLQNHIYHYDQIPFYFKI